MTGARELRPGRRREQHVRTHVYVYIYIYMYIYGAELLQQQQLSI